MRRALLAVVTAAGLAIGTVIPTSALGLTQVTLNCDDATTWTAVVDTDTLASLVASVQGMLDYPAGLTCTLLQTPVVRFGGAALAANSPFITAGGRWQLPCESGVGVEGGLVAGRVPGAWYSVLAPSTMQMTDTFNFFWVNIAVNVHMRDDGSGTFFGSLNETIPANQCPTSSGGFSISESHFSSTGPDNQICMTNPINANVFVTGTVTHTSGGTFGLGGGVTVGEFVRFGFHDSGTPPGQNTTAGTTDTLHGPPLETSQAGPNHGCTGQVSPAPDKNLGTFNFDKQNGNITVHQ